MAVTVGPSNIKLTAQGDTVAMGLIINAISWLGAVTTGDAVTLIDPVTNAVIWKDVASGNGHFIESKALEGRLLVNGLRADLLDSGELFIYYQ